MARQIRVTDTGVFDLGTASDEVVGTLVVEVVVTAPATVSLRFRGRVFPLAADLTQPTVGATSPLLGYTPMQTGTPADGSTAITAAGIYAVPADGVKVAAHVDSLTLGGGAVTLHVAPLVG